MKGREHEVLDALGIRWREGRPHIHCPYPDHSDGDPSWRWQERQARARCTCTRGDSIFDVMMKVEGVTFEVAKVRVAEMLGRADLVREPFEGRQHQATDAASLLRPPPEQRDEGLPIAYLAHRLSVPPAQVPRPMTPCTGFKALAYFDPPPQGSRAKPKLVGHFPCAVFGSLAADGRRHAQRIYVAPGGAGKAKLGIGPSGRPRDPKKSAKVVGETSTAGCAVLWGDPDRVPHLLLAEGIETGAAVALAFSAEIEQGTVAVAAAISAAGLEAFVPWPPIRRVTVAADRDEGEKPDGRPGSRRGERAARAFALRHHERIQIAIALPGSAGQSVDWLDILLEGGIEQVRAGLLAAEPFVPTRAELEEQARGHERTAALERTARDYPLPAMDTVELRYAWSASDRIKVHKLIGTEKNALTGEEQELLVPVSTPFGVPARLRLADRADAYGLRVVVEDMAGQRRSVDFDRADLARMGASEIRARLFEAGLRTEAEGETLVVQALKAAAPEREIVVLRRPGWHRLPDLPGPVFVAPSGEVIGAPADHGVELAVGARLAPAVARAGSLAGWRHAAQAAVGAPACPHWILGTVAGLAGPVLDLAGLDSCGINLSGPSSRGKSTAQRLAASAWSGPQLGSGGLFRSLRVSENAVEAWAETASGTVLPLDDLAHCDGRVVGRLIHAIAGGVGKGRMRADASLRLSYRWRTFALLSAEHSLEETVRRAGGLWQAGMAVRVADVDVTSVNPAVPDAYLRAMAGIEQHFGHAGPAFVRALAADGVHSHPDRLRDRILVAAQNVAGGDAQSTTLRAAAPFAVLLIAGELARAMSLLPRGTQVAEAVAWAWDRFKASSDAQALDPAMQAISNVQHWLLERWDVTVKSIDATDEARRAGASEGRWHLNNRETLGWYDQGAVYLPAGRLGEACGGALKPEALARELDRRGLLAKRKGAKRLTVEYVPKIGYGAWYALSRTLFGRSAAPAGPGFTVHEGAQA